MSYEVERRVAVEAVRKACSLCSEVQTAHLSGGVINKEDRSPVTVADFGAQALVSDLLAATFPEIPLVSEENSSPLRDPSNHKLRDGVVGYLHRFSPHLKDEDSIFKAIDRGKAQGGAKGRFWTLDPIDGTKGFLRGDQYAVALALVDGGRVVVGVLGCPNLEAPGGHGLRNRGWLFGATRDGGAWGRVIGRENSLAIEVDNVIDPARAVICESVEAAHAAHSVQGRIADRLGVSAQPYRIDSQCKYAVVARGEASIYLRLPRDTAYREKVWDHAAGTLIVEEAGGRVTDLNGDPLDFSQGRLLGTHRGIVCTNGAIHDRVLAACRAELTIS